MAGRGWYIPNTDIDTGLTTESVLKLPEVLGQPLDEMIFGQSVGQMSVIFGHPVGQTSFGQHLDNALVALNSVSHVPLGGARGPTDPPTFGRVSRGGVGASTDPHTIGTPLFDAL